ncbi:BREX-1 system adenine-specific DNA-methyltransferase PglX [Cylindrospermopsis curvispora]|uniref:site-specific DNA-methyltransferase (adenine-specific) n=1 Tax=Cylindrospermopsis curvispora GIHE-G1 TaxID=2666332 RepID=A0A7H0F4L4_9CYAN|nr:BREX-1 system adenine-specific DNA-methyltransferase PglX [Cylindrospermopsis curvispora]QNP30980.1 BREX-1 system adenine-specific DNA-methyltransferase PglX [Cylindrospermopsis curvispora GIHE-G1]
MNRTTIKNFAIWARNHLKEQVSTRATQLTITEKTITEKTITDQRTFAGGLLSGEQTLNSEEAKQYQQLHSHIEYLLKQQASKNLDKKLTKQADSVLDILIEEIAYTWFNRLVALRFMEVKGYIGRVLSSSDRSLVDPDILRDRDSIADTGEIAGINRETLKKWEDLASKQTNPDEYLYRQLLLAQCQALSSSVPALFDTGYPALFLPVNLLGQDSIVGRLVKEIAQEDWEDIEIVGWLYQFYISERKDQVIGAKSKIEAKDIPAATQLFTPRWIVQYMVENSLGRLWLENHPQSNLREKMPYYLEGEKIRGGEEQSGDTAPLLGLLNPTPPSFKKVSPGIPLTPEELTVIDPACGSGHILVYAFDLLVEIYKEQGYLEKDIPGLILTHNLYGLDIDERAVQLASFAVLMKARAINKRVFKNAPTLNIKTVRCTRGYKLPAIQGVVEKDWQPLMEAFSDADNLGSLITPPSFNGTILRKQLADLALDNPLFQQEFVVFLRHLVDQAELLSNQYWVVVANPPYMGNRSFNLTIKTFVDKFYTKSKGDLFACFMERTIEMTENYGFMSAINQQSWMFLSTYEELRKYFLSNYTISSMLHLGSRTFPEIGGEVVQSTAFIVNKKEPINDRATYIRLVDYNDSELKRRNFISNKHRYSGVNQVNFSKIPGSAIAYWVSDKILEIFQQSKPLNDIANPCVGLQTGNNDRFLRLWTEVNINNIGFGLDSREAAKKSGKKWFPYNKGGEFRKWYGNQEYVVNWENDGFEIRNFGTEHGLKARSRPQNTDKYFQESITWSSVSSSYFSVRYSPKGFIFDVKGSSIFPHSQIIINLVGLLCSKVIANFMEIMNPTVSFQVGNVANLPIITSLQDSVFNQSIEQAINIAREDWDNFETSWDFQTHPLLRENSPNISTSFTNWQNRTETAFRQLQLLEEENNRYWIKSYGLETELTPEVPEDQVTIHRADPQRDMRSLISYIIGCIMGRYSLDKPGIIHAGSKFDPSLHQKFPASNDAIIPITDQTYFPNDILTRFEEFLQIAWDPNNLSANLKFIADTLTIKNSESPRERIRRYFLQEFISDHIQTYKKRPIYWLFTSGKKRAFNALIYLHRYQEDTLSRMRTDYVLELQIKLQGEITKYQKQLEISTNNADKKIATKRLKELQDQQSELAEYQEKLQHLADARIKLDLDDGVAYNYCQFKGLVYEGTDLKIADLEKASQWKN